MSTDRFTFQTLPELRAFETGGWYSEAPVRTESDGLVLAVTCSYGDEVREHRYVPIIFAPTCDLGDRVLTSRIAFAKVTEAAAFASAIAFFGGTMNVAFLGMQVVVEEKRPDNESDEKIEYKYEVLRRLIAKQRGNLRSDSGSA